MATPSEAVDAVAAPTTPRDTTTKPIHSLVLDTGPLIKNDPSASALIAQAEKLYILPSVIPEIKDRATRTRVETTILPFVTVRSPNPTSLKFVREFARKTGDLSVLSKPDLEVLALGYELECERNGGDWRLRNTPGQKGLNGSPPHKEGDATTTTEEVVPTTETTEAAPEAVESAPEAPVDNAEETEVTEKMENLDIQETVETDAAEAAEPITQTKQIEQPQSPEVEQADEEEEGDASDDDGDWITPSNLTKHKAKDSTASTPSQAPQKTLQAAVLTSDFAMQNVALRMNLNLVTPAFARITHLKTWILRCHGCFKTTKDMDKRFCPNCGQPNLTRTSCSTDQHGNFKIHLKKNFQWNNRGNVYSVPKPTHGSANGRLAKNSAGQGNWGSELILAEDQKEFVRASDAQRRAKKKDLMDDDYLPNILSGDRSGSGKIRVGAGRNINSRRRN